MELRSRQILLFGSRKRGLLGKRGGSVGRRIKSRLDLQKTPCVFLVTFCVKMYVRVYWGSSVRRDPEVARPSPILLTRFSGPQLLHGRYSLQWDWLYWSKVLSSIKTIDYKKNINYCFLRKSSYFMFSWER